RGGSLLVSTGGSIFMSGNAGEQMGDVGGYLTAATSEKTGRENMMARHARLSAEQLKSLWHAEHLFQSKPVEHRWHDSGAKASDPCGALSPGAEWLCPREHSHLETELRSRDLNQEGRYAAAGARVIGAAFEASRSSLRCLRLLKNS